LDQLGEIHLCVGYKLDGIQLNHIPSCAVIYERVEPVYEILPGWMDSIAGLRRYKDLPQAAKRYIERIEELVGSRIEILSVGPKRNATIYP
jgi:adenylosuccinate synthase